MHYGSEGYTHSSYHEEDVVPGRRLLILTECPSVHQVHTVIPLQYSLKRRLLPQIFDIQLPAGSNVSSLACKQNERSPYNAYTACQTRSHVTYVSAKTQCIHENWHMIVITVR